MSADRFNQLPEHVKEFLSELDKEGAETLKTVVHMPKDQIASLVGLAAWWSAASLIGKWFVWVLLGLAAGVTAIWPAIEAIGKAIGMAKGAK